MGAEESTAAGQSVSINPITRLPWTDEDRRLWSERAKEQVRLGQMGGQNNGRRRKLPAYAVIAATAQKNGRALAESLVDIALTKDEAGEYVYPPKMRMDAIKLLTDIEQKAKQERRDDEEHLRKMPRKQLMQAVLDRVTELTGEDYDIDLDPEDFSEDAAGEEPEDVGDTAFDQPLVEQAAG
jgi:hypothetical protein